MIYNIDTPIPVAIPQWVGRIKETGTSKPLEMRCRQNVDYKDYIVKLWANTPLGVHCLAREIYASFLADYFDLEIPGFALIYIDPDFYNCQSDLQIKLCLQNSPGYNFGSEEVKDFFIFNNPIPGSLLSNAARVFFFDILICNIDRNFIKPNLFQKNDHLILIDHEKAFPFSKPSMMVGEKDPWVMIREPWHKSHILYPGLKGKDLIQEIDRFIVKMDSFPRDFFDRIDSLLPIDWVSPDLHNIKIFINSACEKSIQFKKCLQEILA